MAADQQAVRTESETQRRIRETLAKTKANAQRVVQRPTITAGIEVGNATAGEYQEAVRRAAQRRGSAPVGGNTPGAAPAPAARATTVPTADLAPNERAAFQRANPSLLEGITKNEIGADKAKTNVVNAPRPAPIAPALGEGLGPAAPAATNPAGRVARVLASPRVAGAGRIAGRAAPALGALVEGAQVAQVAADDQSTGLDVAGQVAEGTGKFASASAGALAGASLGALGGPAAPVTVPLGALIGGGLGYFAADKAIEYGRGGTPSPIDRTRARQLAAEQGAVKGPVIAQPPQPAAAGQAPAAAAVNPVDQGITPVAERTGAADEVLGNFNGRAITRGESDALSARNLTPGAPQSITDNLALPAAQGGGGGAPEFDANAAGRKRDRRVGDLLDSSTPAGRIYQQLAADKTPTGKRVAAQFASEYMGAGQSEVSDQFGLAASREGDATTLQRGRESDAAQAGLEDKRQANTKKQGQYVFNEDGSITRITDGVGSAVVGEDGKPLKGPKKKGGLEGLQAQETLIKTRLEALDPNNELTTEERAAARKQILEELAAFQESLNGA